MPSIYITASQPSSTHQTSIPGAMEWSFDEQIARAPDQQVTMLEKGGE